MEKPMTLGFSFCPNDTFIFGALVKGFVDTGIKFEPVMADVEELNSLVMQHRLDVSKISYHTLGYVLNSYVMLEVGGALGECCGPLVVAKGGTRIERLSSVVVPGLHTTATLLLRIFFPHIQNLVVMRYDEIMPAVQRGLAEAGLIIHEGRFTYGEYGLSMLADLGEMWERETGLPIPLGGIVAKRSLGRNRLKAVESAIHDSLRFARRNREAIMSFIREHAQEMDDQVISRHISLYVNHYTEGLQEKGRKAVENLLTLAQEREIIPRVNLSPFMD